MSQTDFFELPEGDPHREGIEVETDYDRGVMDERKRWEAKACEWKEVFSYEYRTRCGNAFMFDEEGDADVGGCFKFCPYCGGAISEPKGSE